MYHFLTRSPARLGRLIAALIVASAAGACSGGGDGGTTGVNNAIAGAYGLETINGISLPYVETVMLSNGLASLSIDSSAITLRSQGTFTERIALRLTQSGVTQGAKFDFNGTYALTGTSLRMITTTVLINGVPDVFDPDTVVATLANNVLTTSFPDTLSDGTVLPFLSIYRRK